MTAWCKNGSLQKNQLNSIEPLLINIKMKPSANMFFCHRIIRTVLVIGGRDSITP